MDFKDFLSQRQTDAIVRLEKQAIAEFHDLIKRAPDSAFFIGTTLRIKVMGTKIIVEADSSVGCIYLGELVYPDIIEATAIFRILINYIPNIQENEYALVFETDL